MLSSLPDSVAGEEPQHRVRRDEHPGLRLVFADSKVGQAMPAMSEARKDDREKALYPSIRAT